MEIDGVRRNITFIPGMMLDHEMWKHQVDHIGKTWICTVVDYSDLTSVEEMAHRAGTIGSDVFHLVGFSLGAIIGLEVWRQFRPKVKSLTLMGLNPKADPTERLGARLSQISRARSGELEAMMRDEFIPNYFAKPSGNSPELEDGVVRMALRLGPGTFERQSKAQLRRPESTPTLRRIDVPTLVMCGSDDRITNAKQHLNIARSIPGSQLSVVKGAGHLLTMERPSAVSEALSLFLSKSERHAALGTRVQAGSGSTGSREEVRWNSRPQAEVSTDPHTKRRI